MQHNCIILFCISLLSIRDCYIFGKPFIYVYFGYHLRYMSGRSRIWKYGIYGVLAGDIFPILCLICKYNFAYIEYIYIIILEKKNFDDFAKKHYLYF